MTIKPLYEELTLEEAKERLSEIEREFNKIKGKYTKGLRRLQWWLSQEDLERLNEYSGVLLPLSSRKFEEEKIEPPETEDTVAYKSGKLLMKLEDMKASYINTGTKRLGYSKPFWRD
jgi:hypothetical protein